MRLIIIFLLIVLTAGARAQDKVNWPKAPFKPHLIYTAPNSEEICANYEFEAQQEYFEGYAPQNISPAGYENMPMVEQTLLKYYVSKAKELYGGSPVYRGDIDGDGKRDRIIAARIGGSNISNYRYYHKLIDFETKLTLREVYQLPSPTPRNHPTEARASAAATQAYNLVDSMQMREYKDRLYADVLVPDAEKTDKVLLSYDSEKRPKAECVVAVKLSADVNDLSLFKTGDLNIILQASKHMTGSRGCIRGSSKPFMYRRWRQEEALQNAQFSPWGLFEDTSTKNAQRSSIMLNYSDETIKGQGHWEYVSNEYYWSLEGAFNRRAYSEYQHYSTRAINQLSTYYQENFDVDEQLARKWGGYYIHLIRNLSSGGIRYPYRTTPEPIDLKKIYLGEALAKNFINVASRQRDSDYVPIVPGTANDKALSLAVGAKASVSILAEILALGAEVNNGDEPPLLNAVDNIPALEFLLKSGATIDAVNGFGKTALMMAAHMNEEEAIKSLLNSGAGANVKTWKELPKIEGRRGRLEIDCRYRIVRYRERTALMYAAENASLDVIEMLIDAGADTSAVDSKGRTMLDYLAMNEVMSQEDVMEARKTLAVKPSK